MSYKSKAKILELDLTAKLRALPPGSPALEYQNVKLLSKIFKLEKIFGTCPAQEFKSGMAFIDVESIPLCAQLAHRHPFSQYIKKQSPFTVSEISAITSSVNFMLHLFESGSIPAALNPASDYSIHSWTRDTAIIAYAMGKTKNTSECADALKHLAIFYGRQEQRGRFIGFHYDSDPVGKYRFGHPTNDLPHIRARIDESGHMVESDQYWSHSQLDAIGMWLLCTFHMANSGVLDLIELDKRITAINPDNAIESIFCVAIKFLQKIRFWEQHDHGPWEDKLAPSRASSIGMGIVALLEAERFLEKHGWDSLASYRPHDGYRLQSEISSMLLAARQMLETRLPKDGSRAVETDEFPADSALSFLLFPFNPQLTANQERAILKTLYENRMGEVGFSRRANDEYLGMDYIYNPHSPSFCDLATPNYKAAEWTLFDPLIAGYYYQRYIESSGIDEACLALANRHLKRSLIHISKTKDSYRIAFDQRNIKVPRGRLPEAYWYDSKMELWRANENTPLLMAEAACALMLERALEACKLWELAQKK